MRDEYVKKIKDAIETELSSNGTHIDPQHLSYYMDGLSFALEVIEKYEKEDQKFKEESSNYQVKDKPLKQQVREKTDGPFFGCAGK